MTYSEIRPRQTLRQVASLLIVVVLAMEAAQGQVADTFPVVMEHDRRVLE